jgi:hypothetical protein
VNRLCWRCSPLRVLRSRVRRSRLSAFSQRQTVLFYLCVVEISPCFPWMMKILWWAYNEQHQIRTLMWIYKGWSGRHCGAWNSRRRLESWRFFVSSRDRQVQPKPVIYLFWRKWCSVEEKLILMTSTFDVLSEMPLHTSDFGEGPFGPIVSAQCTQLTPLQMRL